MGINRNIVECKYITEVNEPGIDEVLIETLWNVNSFYSSPNNVGSSGINRNIVECKFCHHTGSTGSVSLGINRNIVECKYDKDYVNYGGRGVLIETLWNVNNCCA